MKYKDKNNIVYKKENIDNIYSIEGFDIEINPNNKTRIDNIVNQYEENIIKNIEEQYSRSTKKSDKIADKMAQFGGSWKFIGIMSCVLTFWIIWNTSSLTPFHFDAPPFILLNLALSFIAAFQAPIILMSQNRQSARDKQEAVVDFAINYKAEQEVNDIQAHLRHIELNINELKEKLMATQSNNIQ